MATKRKSIQRGKKSSAAKLRRARVGTPRAAVRASGAEALRRARAEATAARKEAAGLRKQLAASAQVLKVISESPADVQPVLDAIVRSGQRLFGAEHTAIVLTKGDHIELRASAGLDGAKLKALRASFPRPIDHKSVSTEFVALGKIGHYADITAPGMPAYTRKTGRQTGLHGWLGVPLMRKGESIGGLVFARPERGLFSDDQVALARAFAAQAVIAIQNSHLFNDTREALERQTATAEILKVISESPTDVQPVFQAIVENAARLMAPCNCGINMLEGDAIYFRAAAGATTTPEQLERMRALFPIPFDPNQNLVSRAIAEGRVIHVDPTARDAPPQAKAVSAAIGAQSMTQVPLMKAGKGIGVITVRSDDPAFRLSERQLALIRTFADQAVIAIENVRLFNETKEALERQTATAEILKVIASSPTDVQPVFDAIVESCTRLLACNHATLRLVKGDRAEFAASNSTIGGKTVVQSPMSIHDDAWPTSQAVARGTVVQIPDTAADGVSAEMKQRGEQRGFRSLMVAPLLRESDVIGTINVHRATPGRFTDKEVALLETFASQAVIAIENVRLFNETREALERQTATSGILEVMSGSPTDVQPVFDAIVRSGARLFSGAGVAIALPDAGQVRLASIADEDPERCARWAASYPFPLTRDYMHATAILDGKVIDVSDALDPPAQWAAGIENFLRTGYRAITITPMMRGDTAFGTVSVVRMAPGPLTDKQFAILKTFADQAVIAIENVRLFNETKESLERQTATAEILKVISESPTDVQPVFNAIARSARRLCAATYSAVFLADADRLTLAAVEGVEAAGVAALLETYPLPIGRETSAGRCILDGRIVHLEDARLDSDYGHPLRDTISVRSILSVPMFREGCPLGAISVWRGEVKAFSDKQIALLQTFADQAVIAIENVRLFNETKEALERQTATAEILKVIASSPDDVQPVFYAICRSAARLVGCRVGINVLEGNQIHLKALAAPAASAGMRDLQGIAVPVSLGYGEPGYIEALVEAAKQVYPLPYQPERNYVARAIATGTVTSTPDTEAPEVHPGFREFARTGKYRATANVPMTRDGVGLGTIGLVFEERGRSLDERQEALLRTFADQAVIAIENVRLFNETKEALERQTATAEILKVISESPTDVQPVFDCITESAARLFAPCITAIMMREGDRVELSGLTGPTRIDEEAMSKAFPVPYDSGSSLVSRAIASCQLQQIMDSEAADAPAAVTRAGRAIGFRALTVAPLLRDGVGVGAISIASPKVGYRLSEKQLLLLQTFADQAVIAIENVRLFKELEQRTEALTRSVGQLTALGEVSQTISSTLDLEKVLPTIVSRAVQLTGLDGGAIYEYDEVQQVFTMRAGENVRQEILELDRNEPIRIGEGAVGRAAATRKPVQVPDIAASAAGRQTRGRDVLLQIGARALLAVPLLREGHILGALAVIRNTPGEFPLEVIALLETFATQSAIAIQNARLFREIEEKSRQLEEASQHKSQFLASMSHELRTPLNAILGFNEMILGDIYGEVSEDMRPPLAQMQSSGKHLLGLINNVLDLAKIEANKMELSLADYAVQDTLAMVRATLQALASEKGLEFVVSAPEDLPLVYGDGGRLSQCLINLAGNAIKFTKEGRVEIGVAQDGEMLRFSVSDTGIGIPPDKIDSLFTEFKQTDAAIASEYGGTGLGLAITKKFIEMHGGRIWIESELGKGSTFLFEIPLRVQSGAAA